jgi:TatD DNase family protein
VIEMLSDMRPAGAILHWFLGTDAEVPQAVEIGCFFSVNAAMTDEQIRRVPLSRMLPETDYPSTRRRGGGARPGDVAKLTARIAALYEEPPDQVRYRWRRNLLSIATTSGALDSFPSAIADMLLAG